MLYNEIIQHAEDHPQFTVNSTDIIRTTNFCGIDVVCLPRNQEIITAVIMQAHDVVGHFGTNKTLEYLRHWYWWPQMHTEVTKFCQTHEACQRAKTSNQHLAGKLHSLPIPTKPWDSIGMDFIGPFPESKDYNYLWVVICWMTSMVHLIPVCTTMKASELSWLYL